MIYLYATICLAGDPANCRDLNLQFQPPEGVLSVMTCAGRLPTELLVAEVTTNYPGYLLKRWKCTTKPLTGV